MDISNWIEISPGIFVAPDAGFGGDVGQAVAQTVSTAVASGAQTAGQYYSQTSAPLPTGTNINSYKANPTPKPKPIYNVVSYDGSGALASAQQGAAIARAGISRRRRLLRYRSAADQAARRSLSVLQGSTSSAGTARATKAKKKKGRTKSNVRLGSVQASPGSSLNISL